MTRLRHRPTTRLAPRILTGAVAVSALALAAAGPAQADRGWHGRPTDLPKVPLMVGGGGAVSSVDRDASQVGIDVLTRGGNAADAAVATAAALGVTEPYSAGIGGGGFLVYYDAKTKGHDDRRPGDRAEDLHREHLPQPRRHADELQHRRQLRAVHRHAGYPGALGQGRRRLGTWRLSELMKPAERLAADGFVVDQTFHDQTAANAARFARFPATAAVFLPGGQPPAVGSTFRNPDMAKAYRELRTQGVEALYAGAASARPSPPRPSARPRLPVATVMGGQLTSADLAAYRALSKAPITSRYRGYDVYGMPVPSSGGIAVAEILNLVEAYEAKTGTALASLDDAHYLHWFSEASATAFADRNRYVGDVPGVPVGELTSQAFADERACLFDPNHAQTRPIPYGTPDGSYTSCATSGARQGEPYEGQSTTHLVTADKWGNVASYTLTIEQTGGSGITVPGYGFLLNNELTDFDFVPLTPGVPDPNLPGPGKRPRSSMSPTIILKDGAPYLSVGSPGGATIITSVSQTVLGYLDRGLPLVDAIAAPRLSSRNGAEGAEPPILDGSVGTTLRALGHTLVSSGTPNEIGAVTAIHPLGGGRFQAAAETVRRGGGSAMVVQPVP